MDSGTPDAGATPDASHTEPVNPDDGCSCQTTDTSAPWLLLLLGLFISGYVAGRPWNPIPYNELMLFHTLSGMLLMVLIPFTKIAHCVLFPLVRFASEIAWQLTPQGGADVIRTLYGPERRQL